MTRCSCTSARRRTRCRVRGRSRDPFDLIFIDADKQSIPEYFEQALALSHPGSLIITDNVVRGGTLIDEHSDDPRRTGIRRFHELVAAEPRVDATTIQTVGVKGYDGFTLALVVSSNVLTGDLAPTALWAGER